MNIFTKHAARGVLFTACFLVVSVLQAQNIYSRKNGNWNDVTAGNGTWSTVGFTGASCNCVPGAGNTVLIGNNFTVTYGSGAPAAVTIASLTVQNTGTLIFGNGGTITTLTVSGDINVNAGGILRSGASGGTSHDIRVAGNFTNSGTFDQTANAATNQSVTFNSGAAKLIAGASATTTFYNMNVNGTGALSFGDATNARTVVVANDLTIGAGANLQSGNTAAIAHTIQLNGNLVNNGTINLTANAPTNQNMTFNSAAAKSIRGTATNTFTFYNVNVNGAGALSFGDNTATSRTINITNDLTIAASAIFSQEIRQVLHMRSIYLGI